MSTGSMGGVWFIFDDIIKIEDALRDCGEPDAALVLQRAVDEGSTSGEILTALAVELQRLQSDGTIERCGLQFEASAALNFIDAVLHPR